MELQQIRARVHTLGLNRFLLDGSRKALIQAIQEAEGHEPCFLEDDRFSCAEHDCEWRRDCLKLTAAWRR
jgi:hypothetical protein